MANNLTPPLLSPDIQRKQADIQRNQVMAQMLMQQGMRQPQAQMVGGHYVPPSPAQTIANAFSLYSGMKMMRDEPEQMAELQRMRQDNSLARFGFGETPQRLAQALDSSQAQTPAGGQSGPPLPVPSAMAPQTINQSVAGSPMTLPGLSPEQSRMALLLLGDQEYMKRYAAQFEPTNDQRNLSSLTPEQRNRLITAQYLNEAGKDGIQNTMGPDGRVYASAVPGYTGIQAANAGAVANAQEAAKAQYDVMGVPTGNGGTQLMPRSEAVERLGNTGAAGTQQPNQGNLGYTPSEVSQGIATKLNDDWVSGTYRPAVDAAKAATDLKGTITAMRGIPLETGFGTEFQGAAANLLTSLGVKSAEQIATNVQKFQSIAMDRLQNELLKQKGMQTEGDADRAGKTFAKLENTPAANQFILAFAEAKANMDIRRAEFYEAALPLARKAGDLTEIDRRWRKLQGSIWDDPVLAQYKEM